MQTETIPLEETDCFSSFFIDYVTQNDALKDFYADFPTAENFKSAIDSRSFDNSKRSVLVDVLKEQYTRTNTSEVVQSNIQSLGDNNTFTVTTGHQLNIFTGPLYFIYKIVSVINACKSLKKAYPDYHFVPVYWMASEDHDFDEINHFFFEGKKWEWTTDQTGAVGHFDPSELVKMAAQLPKGATFFKDAYAQPTLTDAARHYVNHLFGHEGVVVLDADDAALKKLFVPVMEDDLFIHTAEDLVAKTTASLENLGYKTQVHARQVNFFYLDKGIRERIERTSDGFDVVDTDLRFTDEEIRSMLHEHPERFSPNVILRPLYQETILPNLAYVGGPSEAVYWLQLKALFDHFKSPFPLLMPRNFALVIPNAIKEKWEKTGLGTKALFSSSNDAFTRWVSQNTTNTISYSDELKKLTEVESLLKAKASQVDDTLVQHLEAIHTSFVKKIEKAEKKLLRAEKRKHEEKRRQIEAVKEALFPGGTLQERKDNFLNFYLQDPQFIQRLIDTFDAFNYEMYLLYE